MYIYTYIICCVCVSVSVLYVYSEYLYPEYIYMYIYIVCVCVCVCVCVYYYVYSEVCIIIYILQNMHNSPNYVYTNILNICTHAPTHLRTVPTHSSNVQRINLTFRHVFFDQVTKQHTSSKTLLHLEEQAPSQSLNRALIEP